MIFLRQRKLFTAIRHNYFTASAESPFGG